MRFNMGLLLASIPKRALAKIAAAALDATAFPTYARVHDYRVQKEVDEAIRDAIERGDPDPVPDGSDPRRRPQAAALQARPGRTRRIPQRQLRNQPHSPLLLHRLLRDDPHRLPRLQLQPATRALFRLGYDIAPYVLALSCDPASEDRAPIARELCRAFKGAHRPSFRTVTADREFTPRPISSSSGLHANGIDTIMDYARPLTQKITTVTVGNRGESLYQFCGDFFPLCIPKRFKNPPDPSLTEDKSLEFYEALAKWRYVPNGPPDDERHPTVHLPQCAGHVRFAAKTRMGKYRHGNHPALSLGPPFSQQWCCNGSISIRVEDLNQWQPVPVGHPSTPTALRRGPQPHREHQRHRQRRRRTEQEIVPGVRGTPHTA